MADPIGNLNGKWAAFFKFFLASYPFFILWSAWVTKSIYEFKGFANAGDRFSLQDAYAMERRWEQKLDDLARADDTESLERDILILREENSKLQLYIADKISDFKDEITSKFLRKDEHTH